MQSYCFIYTQPIQLHRQAKLVLNRKSYRDAPLDAIRHQTSQLYKDSLLVTEEIVLKEP